MKHFFSLLLLFLSLFSRTAFAGDVMKNTDLNYVFDLQSLPQISIEVSSKEWNTLLQNFDQNSKNEIYVKSDFIFIKNGKKEVLKNVGLRLRGNVFSKARPETGGKTHNKKDPHWYPSHFRIDFNEYRKNTRFHSLKALNLKAFNGDPAMVREIYCLDLFQRFGVYTAQRSSYVRLSILVKGDPKPAYFGIYRMLEPIDQSYLSKRYDKDKNKGFLWKCLWPSDLTLKGDLAKMGMEDPDMGKEYAYDLKTRKKDFNTAASNFHQFITELNTVPDQEFEQWARTHIDVELLLKAQAVNVLVGMWDDYWINNNNYYLYFDESGVCHFIPYDYDNSLGTSGMNNTGKANVFTWGSMGNDRPLMSRIMKVETYKQQYGEYIAQLISETNELFCYTASSNRITQWHSLISPYTSNDTGQHMDITDMPASWGNASYYRLLTGDNFGGPVDANFFLTRSHTAAVNLGLKKALQNADIKLDFSGADFHEEGKYFILFQDRTELTMNIKSKYKLKSIELKGLINQTIENPGNILKLQLDLSDPQHLIPVSPGWVPRGILDIIIINENKQGIQERIGVFKFDNSYKSPEISPKFVTFRFKYAGNEPVAIHGNFNDWGKDKPLFMTKVSEDMWEYKMPLKDIKPKPGKDDPQNIIRYGYMIMKEQPQWSADKANPNSRRGSSYFYLK